jgi:hypothetical protein
MALFDVCESSFFCPFDATFKIFLPLVLKQNCQYALLVFISGSYKIDPSKSRKLFGISKKSQIPLINMEPMARIQTMHT